MGTTQSYDIPQDASCKKPTQRNELKLPNNSPALAFTLDNVLTEQECKDLIEKSEARGYEQALLNVGGGAQILATDTRKSSRCIWDSPELSGMLFSRIKDHLPEYWYGHRILGLNERLRFLRYDTGEYFKPHYDGCYVRENGETSFITVHLYLNEGYVGGSTTFLDVSGDTDRHLPLLAKTGMVLVFEHHVLHEGSLLESGRKYTVRTDVMYTKEIHKDENGQLKGVPEKKK